MDCLVSNEVLRIVGGLVFLLLLVFIWVGRTAVEVKVDDYDNGGMALQRSGKSETVKQVVGEKNDPVRERLRKGLRVDYVFIFSYAALFAALGLVFSQTHVSGAKLLGLGAVVFILGAAAFDLCENSKIFEILALDKESIDDSLCRSVFIVSTLKWLLFFLTAASLAVIFIKLWNWYSVIGLLMALGAVVGIAGIFSHKLIPPAVITLSLGVFILGLILIAAPQKIMRLIC